MKKYEIIIKTVSNEIFKFVIEVYGYPHEHYITEICEYNNINDIIEITITEMVVLNIPPTTTLEF